MKCLSFFFFGPLLSAQELSITPLDNGLFRLTTEEVLDEHSRVTFSDDLLVPSWKAHEEFVNGTGFLIRQGSQLDIVVTPRDSQYLVTETPPKAFFRLEEIEGVTSIFTGPVPALVGKVISSEGNSFYSFTNRSEGFFRVLLPDDSSMPFVASLDLEYQYQDLGAGMAKLDFSIRGSSDQTYGLIRYESATELEVLLTEQITGVFLSTSFEFDWSFVPSSPSPIAMALPPISGKTLEVEGRDENGEDSIQVYVFSTNGQVQCPSPTRSGESLTTNYQLTQAGSNTYLLSLEKTLEEPAAEIVLAVFSENPFKARFILNTASDVESVDLIDFGIVSFQ